VGLHEHGVDLLETDGLGAVAHGFDAFVHKTTTPAASR
jgi:hypothetical protein